MKDTITIKGKTYTRAEWREHCEQLKKEAGERNRARNEALEREAEQSNQTTTNEQKEEENTMKNTNTAENAVTLTDIIKPIKGEYAEDVLDYNGNVYICDAISEIADNHTSIYYSDILHFISSNPEALAEVVEEGLYMVDSRHPYDLYKHGQVAEYMTIERDIYNHLDDAIRAYAANYLRTAYHTETVSADTWDAIAADLDDIDNNNRFDDITDIIDEHMTEDEDEEE